MVEDIVEERHSSQTYLRVAEAVLASTNDPLSAREIVERGIERGLFGDHALSRTPEKSMQARLSIDIKNNRQNSKFMRVARGRFVLRKSTEVDGRNKQDEEYIAESRRLRLPTEEILCSPEKNFSEVLTFQGIDGDHSGILPSLLRNTVYVDRAIAEERNDAKQFITYVLVQSGHRVLSYRRSYLSRAAEFLRGAKFIGFGGHVTAGDHDIFSAKSLGIEACARREVGEELAYYTGKTLESRVSHHGSKLFRSAPLECLGILNDDSSEVGRRHLAVLYRIWLDEWSIAQNLTKGEPSVRSLSWIDLTKARIDITEYEYWSQLCLRRYFPANIISEPVIRHRNLSKVKKARIIVVAGRIGSGKSETAQFLADQVQAKIISSGAVLRTLMQVPPLKEIGREEFQRRAYEFIQGAGASRRLAQALTAAVEEQKSSRVIIDGVRHLETLSALEQSLGEEIALIYVHTPPDMAYEMYRFRESSSSLDFPYRKFLTIFDAPVESELPSLGRSAHTYVYNFLGIDAMRRALNRLVAELS